MVKTATRRKQRPSPSVLKAFKLLSSSNYHLAGGLREDTINDFLVSHWKTEGTGSDSVYFGKGRLDNLELSYEYVVTEPGNVDLAPLTPAKFQKLYQSWLSQIPELGRFMKGKDNSLADDPPPNVRVTVPMLKLKIVTDSAPQVTLDIGIIATGYVEVVHQGGRHTVRIRPINVRLIDPSKVEKAIDQQLSGLGTHIDGDDDCIALKKVILHIANVLLADRIGSFIKELELPLPIELFDGVHIRNADVEIVDNLLVVLAHVSISTTALSLSKTMVTETHDIAHLAEVAQSLLKTAEQEFKAGANNKKKAAPIKKLTAKGDYPNRGVFLWLHQRFFQLLADKLLVMEQSNEDCSSWWIFKFCYGSFLRTWGPVAIIAGKKLNIELEFQGGAWAKACIETHCGDLCHTISATADAKPAARVESFFYFENGNELWVSARPKPFRIDWTVDGLPFPFNKFIEIFLEILSNFALLFVVLLGKRWKRKLTTLPEHFPGTSLKYVATFDKQIIGDPSDSALMALGEVDFKP